MKHAAAAIIAAVMLLCVLSPFASAQNESADDETVAGTVTEAADEAVTATLPEDAETTTEFVSDPTKKLSDVTPRIAEIYMTRGGVSQRLLDLYPEYPNGSFFTVSGSTCAHGKSGTCTNCSLLSIHPELVGKCVKAWQCVAFARYVMYKVFGFDNYGIDRDQEPVDLDEIRPGDLIRTSSHDSIFLFEHEGWYYVYEANNTDYIDEVSFASIPRSRRYMENVSIYRAPNYDEVDADPIRDYSAEYPDASELSSDPAEAVELSAAYSVFERCAVIGNIPSGMPKDLFVREMSYLFGKSVKLLRSDGEYVSSGDVLLVFYDSDGGYSDGAPEYSSKAYTLAVKYDVDGDSEVSAFDARLALRGAIELDELEAYQLIAAELDPDAVMTTFEARTILRAALGIRDA
ncbi:MAG: hypothetical protein K6C36_00310 [Clostridia bacterium]|nr:hypothetical protein [Clostridia bacterium]